MKTLQIRRTIECLAIYGGGPLLVLGLRRAGVLFVGLWVGAIVAWMVTRRHKPQPHHVGREVRRIVVRFACLAPLIAVVTWWLWPQSFLSLPRQKPAFWLLIMVLYPLLSVWPQEVLYRAFFFTRYGVVFKRFTVVASAALFGFAHVIFVNPIAIGMTAIGGFLFASDYARHRSLRLTCFEHSLYGCFIFTVGLGRFFYTGAAWQHH